MRADASWTKAFLMCGSSYSENHRGNIRLNCNIAVKLSEADGVLYILGLEGMAVFFEQRDPQMC